MAIRCHRITTISDESHGSCISLRDRLPFILLCTTVYAWPPQHNVMHAVASRALHNIVYVADSVFTGYVMVAALVNDAALSVVLYVIYYIFLRTYSEISYMISHLFFLVVFITLY